MLHLIAALLLGLLAGFILCASGVGLTARDLTGLTAACLIRTRTWVRRTTTTPGQAVDAAMARVALAAPVDHPLAPTLDDLADDDAADPICAAAFHGTPLDLAAAPYLSCRQVVQHLEAHGWAPHAAKAAAAAMLGIRPVALDKILAGGARPTTDADLAHPFDRIPPMLTESESATRMAAALNAR